MPLGAALLMYTGIGAAAVVVPLLLVGLVILIVKQLKKEGETLCNCSCSFPQTQTACCGWNSFYIFSLFLPSQKILWCLMHQCGVIKRIQRLNFDHLTFFLTTFFSPVNLFNYSNIMNSIILSILSDAVYFNITLWHKKKSIHNEIMQIILKNFKPNLSNLMRFT